MALLGFVRKQFIDVLEWTESGDGTLTWRYPMLDREIQNGTSLTVRESQLAIFVNEGRFADVFAPGRYTSCSRARQERRVLLRHAPASRPALGHDAAGDDPR